MDSPDIVFELTEVCALQVTLCTVYCMYNQLHVICNAIYSDIVVGEMTRMFSDVLVERHSKASQQHQRVKRTDNGLIQSLAVSVRLAKAFHSNVIRST